MTHPAYRSVRMNAPPLSLPRVLTTRPPQKVPMPKPIAEIDIPAAKRFTREDVETALALVGELNATPGGSPRSLTVRDVDAAVALASCARIAHRIAENECNGYRDQATEDADARRLESVRVKTRKILATIGLPGVNFSVGGDPRGACFFLHFPHTKRQNTWGGGWAVS